MSRYARQTAVPEFGPETQRLLEAATVAIVGCGALGSLQAELLARMGVGALRLADPDIVTLGNLHRQTLFDERDAAAGTPKVAAAATRLAALRSGLDLQARAERITRDNLADFADRADLLLDATDSPATRFLLNDYAVRHGRPWIYAGVAGTGGLVLPVIPPQGPCLRCLYPDPPGEEDAATCAVSGILPTAVTLAVSLQLTQALRILNGSATPGTLLRLDAWAATVRTVTLRRDPACPCCGLRRFDFLDTPAPAPLCTSLCGQRMIRIEPAFWPGGPAEAARALERARSRGAAVTRQGLLWSVTDPGARLSLFPDGHLHAHDCDSPEQALAQARRLFLDLPHASL